MAPGCPKSAAKVDAFLLLAIKLRNSPSGNRFSKKAVTASVLIVSAVGAIAAICAGSGRANHYAE
ncbi:MAG: hypothetical protein A3F78_01890 [Burkholderiales bacterium RIFCSPLOWO2_12_FULL_61_40]|nr:MAG: hypothetical protein A3F78_01890 [Burkholderiales bacterium RIFCSPLOWO2_12_FULL_61_40]